MLVFIILEKGIIICIGYVHRLSLSIISYEINQLVHEEKHSHMSKFSTPRR